MSGSPVYIEGKLVGAVALGFPFSKQPIAGTLRECFAYIRLRCIRNEIMSLIMFSYIKLLFYFNALCILLFIFLRIVTR